jgi:hypothetical protein
VGQTFDLGGGGPIAALPIGQLANESNNFDSKV